MPNELYDRILKQVQKLEAIVDPAVDALDANDTEYGIDEPLVAIQKHIEGINEQLYVYEDRCRERILP